MSKLLEAKKTIHECEVSIKEIEEKLIPMKKELSDLETSRRLYGSYIDDLKTNKEMLDKIEVIKYYTSPTTGIQLVFATLYLSKILEKANWMLSGLFGGACQAARLPAVRQRKLLHLCIYAEAGNTALGRQHQSR